MGLLTKAATTIARGLGLSSPQLASFFSGGPTYSGRTVTADSALTLDAFWACVRLVAGTIATLPLEMYRDGGGGDGVDKVDPKHPLRFILHDQPNVEMTAVEFWTALVACKLIWGNGYAQIVRGAGGRVVALLPMRSDRVQVVWNSDGTRTYRYTWQHVSLVLEEEDVLHVKGFSLDGLVGLSVIAYARHSLGNALAAEESAGSLFKNAMRPSGYMKTPAGAYLTAPQREQAEGIIGRFSGAQNTGKVPLLEGGWSFERLEIPPEDAQLLETRGFGVETVCRWFGVAPVMIGHMTKSTAWGSGLEQMNLWFLTYGLRPHLKVIEQAISARLILPADRSTTYAKFNVEALLRADSKGRAELFRTYVTNGIMTVNEVRRHEGLPPLDGGDQLVMQSAMVPITKLGEVASLPHLKPVEPGADAVEADRGLKFSLDQARDAIGRWAGGGGGSPAEEAEERADFKRSVLLVAAGGAVIAGTSMATALTGGVAPAGVAAVAYVAENFVLAEALNSSIRRIAKRSGITAERVRGFLDGTLDTLGVKAEGPDPDLARRLLVAMVDAVYDRLDEAFAATAADAHLPASAIRAGERAIAGARAAYLDRLAAARGGGPTGRAPFEDKAFDPHKHPRGDDGRFSGSGASDRRARRIAQRAISDRRYVDNVELGRVPGHRFSEHAERDVDGWRFELDADGVRHTNNHHGPASGDRNPVRPGDFENLRRVLQRGVVRRGEGRTRAENLPVVTVDHTVKGEVYHAVLTVRKRYRTLRLHSFSKKG